ncbi:MAG: hypothetical protein DI565_13465 [Ancylobacter novellus]|uniref:Uncharacterized protein n=1 Tax=Ancylobacter novellus TaxID=921 RepID=A0A2W5K9J0_ANCNO|nr:MAG: hypothetical protein DI565_13465 [Ancylobacter novellus]
MQQIARNVLGLLGAVALMAVLAIAAFIVARSNPTISVGWFFAAAGVSYTMIILLVLHKE